MSLQMLLTSGPHHRDTCGREVRADLKTWYICQSAIMLRMLLTGQIGDSGARTRILEWTVLYRDSMSIWFVHLDMFLQFKIDNLVASIQPIQAARSCAVKMLCSCVSHKTLNNFMFTLFWFMRGILRIMSTVLLEFASNPFNLCCQSIARCLCFVYNHEMDTACQSFASGR